MFFKERRKKREGEGAEEGGRETLAPPCKGL